MTWRGRLHGMLENCPRSPLPQALGSFTGNDSFERQYFVFTSWFNFNAEKNRSGYSSSHQSTAWRQYGKMRKTASARVDSDQDPFWAVHGALNPLLWPHVWLQPPVGHSLLGIPKSHSLNSWWIGKLRWSRRARGCVGFIQEDWRERTMRRLVFTSYILRYTRD